MLIARRNEWKVHSREPETIEIAVCPNPTRSCLVPESLDGTMAGVRTTLSSHQGLLETSRVLQSSMSSKTDEERMNREDMRREKWKGRVTRLTGRHLELPGLLASPVAI